MFNTTRRSVLKGTLASAAALQLPAFASTVKRPNILFLMVDQLHYNAISGRGNKDVETPNIDRLLAAGTSVENSYCASPVCIPCRSTMLSGRMPSETGLWINTANQPGRLKLPSIGAWLADMGGYESIYAGKYHVPQCHTYNIPGFEVIASGLEHRGEPGDSGVARACEAWLYNRQNPQPFFMICSLINPHDVCHWLSINTDHDPDRLERYPYLEDLSDLPELPSNFSVEQLMESQRQKSIRTTQQPTSGGWHENDWRYYLWAYYRQVEMVDAEIGRVLDALEATGRDQNTLIVFTSDHGEGCGEHQMVRKGYLYDSAARVPLVFTMPSCIAANHINRDALAGTLDLVPTLCDFAGVNPPPHLTTAQSLYPVLTNVPGAPMRDCVVTEHNDPARNKPTAKSAGRSLRTKQYKYITYFDQDVEQLFDLEADPGEVINLAGQSQYKTVLEQHRVRLREWENALNPSPVNPESPWRGEYL